MTVGGTRTVTVTAPAGCAWSASSSATWITIDEPSVGTGTGTLTLRMTSNTGGLTRLGIVTIAGWRVVVSQTAVFPPPRPSNLRIISKQ
jgi:hypothetical protein